MDDRAQKRGSLATVGAVIAAVPDSLLEAAVGKAGYRFTGQAR